MAVRFRRLFQFSLRSLLLLAVLVGLVCGVILIPAARSRRELPVIERIEKRGGTAVRSFVPTPAIEFAARVLGQEPFLRVTEVSLAESGATDADLLALGHLSELRILDLSHTYVTDDGLARLVSGLPELRELNLTLANIGPRGLAALAGNANLETVYTSARRPITPTSQRWRRSCRACRWWNSGHGTSRRRLGTGWMSARLLHPVSVIPLMNRPSSECLTTWRGFQIYGSWSGRRRTTRAWS